MTCSRLAGKARQYRAKGRGRGYRVTIPDGELVTEALAAACRHGQPVYDVLYAVLARRHACSVLTRDGRLIALLGTLGIPAIGAP